ncbi:MAG: tetratricopeptide repeat protein [Bacteroidia bacterium]
MRSFLVYLLFLLCLTQGNLFSQNSGKTDSLKQLLNRCTSDSAKLRLYNLLGHEFRKAQKYAEALEQLRSAEKLAEKCNDKRSMAATLSEMGITYEKKGEYEKALDLHFRALKANFAADNKSGIAKSYNSIGINYSHTGKPVIALNYLQKSLKLFEELKDPAGIASNYHNMGMVEQDEGDYPKAIDHYLKALKTEEKENNKPGMAGGYCNIGIIYDQVGDYPKALGYYQRSLKLFTELNELQGLSNCVNNIGVTYQNQGNYDSALVYYRQALSLREKIKDRDGIAGALHNIAIIQKQKGNYDEALKNYLQALKIQEELKDKVNMALTTNNIGRLYFEIKKYENAISYAERSLKLAEEVESPDDAKEAHELLSNSYTKKGDYKKALEHYILYMQFRDSLLNQENVKEITQKEMQFEFDKKEEAQKAKQEKENLAKAEELRRQKLLRNGFVIGSVLLLFVAFLILRNLRQNKKASRIITEQKKEVEEKKHLLEEKNKEITDSIHYAKAIQTALLASDELLQQNLPGHFVLFKPKDIVSGDFYWAGAWSPGAGTSATHKDSRLETTNFYLAVCDSTGHGVPGAFMSLLNISFLNEAVNEKKIHAPAEALNHVRKRLITSLSQEGRQDGMDCVLCCFDFHNLKLSYASANNAFYLVRNRELIHCAADKMPVGRSPKDELPFILRTVELQKGDCLYLFTDGYADQFGGPKGKKFKYKQLEELLLSIDHLEMDEQRNILGSVIENWRGNLEQVDDILIIGIRV